MRKFWICAVCCLLLCATCLAADYTVTRISADCSVRQDGSSRITQKIELEVPQKVTQFTIPVAMNARDISVEGAQAELFQQAGASYARLTFPEPFFGAMTVTAVYTVDGTVEEGETEQNYTCELLSGLWEAKVERFNFTVILPEGITQAPTFSSGYHGPDVMDAMTPPPVMEGRAISGIVRGGLLDRESFSLRLTAPAGFFEVGSPIRGDATTWIMAGVLLVLMALGLWYWFRTLRASRLKVQARTMPPDNLTPAEIQVILCGGRPSFGLLVCHWASLGYLTITVNSAGRILLRKCMDVGSERREDEKKLFEILFGPSDVCEACGSRYQRAAELADRALRRHWFRRLYEKNTGSVLLLRALASVMTGLALLASMNLMLPAAQLKWLFLAVAFVAGTAMGTAVYHGITRLVVRDWKWVAAGAASLVILYCMGRFGGGFAPMVIALAADIAVGLVTRRGGRHTTSGADLTERAMGFCRFLQHAEDQHLCQMLHRDPQYFYSTMLYAHSCGVGRRFARSFGDTRLEDCPWLTFSGRTAARAYPYYLQFEALLRKLDR